MYPEYAYNFELGLSKYFNQSKNYISIRGFTTLISRHIGRSDYVIFADTSTPDIKTILYPSIKLGESIKFEDMVRGAAAARLLLGRRAPGTAKRLTPSASLSRLSRRSCSPRGPTLRASPVRRRSAIQAAGRRWACRRAGALLVPSRSAPANSRSPAWLRLWIPPAALMAQRLRISCF